jgi:amidohydrolase
MHLDSVDGLEKVTPEITEIRRHLHRHPELSNREHETAAFIANCLDRWDIPHETGVAGTGVVGLIGERTDDGPTVALRADMDALPVTEESQHAHASANPGVMHACGHDAHCAMVLGAARILARRREHLRGRVKLIFQPSEEADPSGAKAMIQAGALEAPRVDAVMGLHVLPHLRTGRIALRPGPASASADEFQILVHGRAGHAAYPHQAVDPIVAASNVVVALQTIASRRVRANDPVVVTVAEIHGGTKANVIPPTVELAGTFRTLSPAVREQVGEEIDRIAQGVANSHGATAEVKIAWGCPGVDNHPDLCDALTRVGERLLGEGNVQILPEALMGADDFAYYQREVPGVLFRLGTGNPAKGTEFPLHHPRFDVDEDALPIGAGLFAETAEEMLAGDLPATP